jgi:hypothetical protein
MKVARTVLAGGKGGDNVKLLPICHEEDKVGCGSLFRCSTNGQVNSLKKSYYFELNHIVKEQNKVSKNDQSTLVGYSGSG